MSEVHSEAGARDHTWVEDRRAEIVAVRDAQGLAAAVARLTAAAAAAPSETAAGDLAVALAAEHGIWVPTA
jgi:hypothetical protein